MLPARISGPVRWLVAASTLTAIVCLYRTWLHVNPTTVALTLLLFILVLAARWGLRYAVAASVASTLCYNFFFLPPLGTFIVTDPQNWLALLAFLGTSVIASRLSARIREEAQEARAREREVEVLFQLSRDLLQTDKVAELLRTVPDCIARATGAAFVLVYLADGDQTYTARTPPATLDPRELLELPAVTRLGSGLGTAVPLRAGVRPRGVLVLESTFLSEETLKAIGGLVSISIDRAQALENAARSEAAKESERLRSLMLDSITHELRTPLTSIKVSATSLLASPAMALEFQRDLLTVIDEETDRLNRLVAQAVEMAQLDTLEVQMQLRATSIEEVLQRGMDACAAQLAMHQIEMHVEPHMPRVQADAVWMQKVVANLLENAAKYSPAGSCIAVTASSDVHGVAVSVADQGVGIDPAEQVLIFEKFYRGRAHSQRRPGTGMGLAICRAIVEAHHGTIQVSSVPEAGSTFTFSLPARRGRLA